MKYNKKILQKGIEKGIKKGEKKKAIETAKKMLSLNYTVVNICAVTGLPRKEVEGLKGS